MRSRCPRILDSSGRPYPRSARRSVRATYDAAQTTTDNARHWANAGALSADGEASPYVRQEIRNRARYEVGNNPYAKGMIQTLANDTIGRGPRLQMLGEDEGLNETIERKFAEWTRAIGLAAKLRTMRMGAAVDGESFLIQVVNPALSTPVKLDVKLVEADQVATPNMGMFEEDAIDGIHFDKHGNPQSYDIFEHHPGDPHAAFSVLAKADSIPAAAVIHYFRVDRAGQHRGISEIVSALPLFGMLRRYTLAVIAAAETAADFAGVIQTDNPPDTEESDLDEHGNPLPMDHPEAMDLISLEQRMLTVLPAGYKLGQMRAEQPATTYEMFKRAILCEIGRCLCMPYSVGAADSAGYNFASVRMDHENYRGSIYVERDHIENITTDRLFANWFARAVLVTGYLPQRARQIDVDLSHCWIWDGFQPVDEAKAAKALAQRLASGVSTYAKECGSRGDNWRGVFKQQQREQVFARKCGLVLAPAGVSDDNDEGEKDDDE